MKLSTIRNLIDEATEGPWDFHVADSDGADWFVSGPPNENLRHTNDTYFIAERMRSGDAEFCAMARQLLPQLLAVAEAAERLNKNITVSLDLHRGPGQQTVCEVELADSDNLDSALKAVFNSPLSLWSSQDEQGI